MKRTKGIYLALLVLLSPMAANADLVFDWEFTDQFGSGGTVSGTIAGLVEGSNDGTGLVITVDSTPTGELTGSDWDFLGTGLGVDAFTVLSGAVVFADVVYLQTGSSANYLFFGGFGGYYPELADYVDYVPDWGAPDGATTFTSRAVPEPGTLALLGLGLVGMAARRRKTV